MYSSHFCWTALIQINNGLSSIERSNNLGTCLCREEIRLTLQYVLAPELLRIELFCLVRSRFFFYSTSLPDVTSQLNNQQANKNFQRENSLFEAILHTQYGKEKQHRCRTRSMKDIIPECLLDLRVKYFIPRRCSTNYY